MATLEGQSVANSYKDLLQVSNANTGIDGTPRLVSDGQGTDSILYLSTDKVGVGGTPTSHLEIISAGTDSQTSFVISGYNDQIDKNPELVLRKSHSDTSGAITETPNDTILGVIKFSGVDDSNAYDNGVTITAEQNGSSGALVPTDLKFVTNGPSTANTDQLVLHHDGGIAMGTDNPNGTLHVHTASAGAVNADGDADDLVVENDASGGISIITPDTNPGRLAFGSPSDNYGAVIMHQQSTGKLSINTEGATGNISMATGSGTTALTIDSSQHVGIGVIPDGISFRVEKEVNGNWAGLIGNTHATNGSGLKVQAGDDANVDSFRVSDVSNNTLFNINGAGKIGVGTGSPNEGKLVVQDGTKAELVIKTSASATDTEASLMFKTSTDTDDIRKKGGIIYKDVGDNGVGDMFFVLDSATDNGNATVADDTAMVIKNDGTADHKGNYIVNEQGRQNHVANTMSSPYYRMDGDGNGFDLGTSANLEPNTGDFSMEAWIYLEDTAGNNHIFASFGSTGIFWKVDNNFLRGLIYSGSGNNAFTTSNVTLATSKWYHVAWTVDRSSATGSKLYINGVESTYSSQDDVTGASGNISSTGNKYLSRTYNSTNDGIYGSMIGFKFYNLALSATEVKELYSGASVPYKYKGANQTNIFTGIHDDFDTNSTNHFAFQSNYSQYQATGFTGSGGAISVVNNVMAMTGIASGHGINGSGLVTKGKKYRMTFNVTAITGNWYLDYYNQSESAFSGTGLKIVEWTAGGSDLNMFSAGSGGALTIDASSIVMELVPIGAVAEYDGSGIASDKWNDKSGNDLHGTVNGASVENAPSNDDGLIYEEGTFSPLMTGITNTTWHTLAGFYKRIGNLVSFKLTIRTTTGDARNSSNVEITGLPYTSDSTSNSNGGAYISISSDFDDDDSSSPHFNIEPNTSKIEVFKSNGSRFIGTDMDSVTVVLRLNGQYYT